MTDITYAMPDYSTFKAQCGELMALHFLEVAAYRGGNLDMDDASYEAMSAGNALRIIVAYNAHDMPIGYIVNLVHNDVHDQNQVQVSMDLIYVLPAYRAEHVGVTLYKLAEVDLQVVAPGARWLTSVPIDGASANKKREGLVKFGFKPVERIYMKTVGES